MRIRPKEGTEGVMDVHHVTVVRGATRLHVLDTANDAPPVLILHGLAGSSREFLPTAEALHPDFRTILVDQRGHGQSTRRPSDTSRSAFVEDVVAVVRHVTAGTPVTLVGQSMGAHTAVLTAASHPDLIDRLVLLEGHVEARGGVAEARRLGEFFASWPLPFPDRTAARAFLGDGPLASAWIDDLDEGPDGLRPRFDADIMEATMRDVLATSRWAEWEGLTVPALVVFAENGMFTEQQKVELVRRRPGTRRVDIPGAGHDAHLEAFDQWIQVLRSHLTDTG